MTKRTELLDGTDWAGGDILTADDLNDTFDVLSTNFTWDILAYHYTSKEYDASAEISATADLTFNITGTKMYILDNGTDDVFQYSLSSAWDVSTAVYDNVSLDVTAYDSSPQGIFFKSDGLKLYIVGGNNDDIIQYNLSSAWDLSSASYIGVKNVFAQDNSPSGVHFNTDGTKMYVSGIEHDSIYTYNLSTAWLVSSASYSSTKSVSAENAYLADLFITPDGKKIYTYNSASLVHEYRLGTAWDMSTASYYDRYLDTSNEESSGRGVFIDANGSRLYVCGFSGDKTIYQYNI